MSNSEKNKGGLKPWATAEQKAWLASRLQSYITSRSSKSPSDFWATTFDDWFEKWRPEEGDNVDEQRKQRKAQIKDWFKNHSRTSGSTGERRRMLLDFGHKKAKKLPLWQAYSKRYYEEKLKDVVQERWIIKYTSENPEPEDEEQRTQIPPPPLQFRNEVIRKMYEEESEEVKNEVKAYRDKPGIDESETIDDEVGPEESERRKIAANYQLNIDALQPTMASVLEQIQEKTGFVGMILLAGPEPGQGGNISILEFHSGKSASGNDFSAVYKDYIANIRKPFLDFTSGIFPPATRSARALPDTEHLANYALRPEIHSHPTRQPGSSVSASEAGSGISSHSVLDPNNGLSSDLGDTRPSKGSKSKHRRVVDSDDTDDEKWNSSASEDSLGRAISWSPSPKPGEPSDVATEYTTTQKRKALEEELRKLNESEAKAAAKKRKLQGKRSVKSKVPHTTDSITSSPPLADATSSPPLADATSSLPLTDATLTLPLADATPTPRSSESTPTLPSTESTPTPARANAIPMPSQANVISDRQSPSDGKIPSWLQPFLPELGSSYASPEMKNLVNNLPVLDTLLGHPTSKRSSLLPSLGRPHVISVWVAGGRRVPPKIDDLRDFVQTWRTWWKSLQPSLRATARFSKLPRAIGPDDNWETLQKGGINGFFTVVASLSWWFAEVKTDAQRKDFNSTVSDVLWAQEQVIASLRDSSEAQVATRVRRSARA